MSLAVMEHLLYNAKKNKKAVGAFNIANMEALMGVIKAAEYSAQKWLQEFRKCII